jgi:hypothetical protein
MSQHLSKNEFEMVQDAMNAIQIAEQQDFVKTFDSIKGFSHSIDTRLQSVFQHIQYAGHSGSSIGITMRKCQYYLTHLEEWEHEKQYQNTSLPQ